MGFLIHFVARRDHRVWGDLCRRFDGIVGGQDEWCPCGSQTGSDGRDRGP